MPKSESRLHAFLEERLRDLRSWLNDALEVAELRDSQTVRQAKAAFLKLVRRSWDDGAGDVDGSLAWALEMYVESGPRWADDPKTFQQDMPLSAEPAWELPEFHLLVASTLADHALIAFEKGTKEQLMLAAMLYADAVETREHWNQIRGPAGARNPDTWRGRLHEKLLSIDKYIAGKEARKQNARNAAKAKLANDAKQTARVKAKELWLDWQEGRTTHNNQAAFARHICETLGLKDQGNVENWCRKWRMERQGG